MTSLPAFCTVSSNSVAVNKWNFFFHEKVTGKRVDKEVTLDLKLSQLWHDL